MVVEKQASMVADEDGVAGCALQVQWWCFRRERRSAVVLMVNLYLVRSAAVVRDSLAWWLALLLQVVRSGFWLPSLAKKIT